MAATWLLKTEPGEYALADLKRDGSTTWDGVSNAQALANLRKLRRGDLVLVYHTGDEKAIVGSGTVESNPVEDPASPGLTADGLPKTPLVKIRFKKTATKPLALAEMKADARFAGWALVKQPRLSVMDVPPELARLIRDRTGL